ASLGRLRGVHDQPGRSLEVAALPAPLHPLPGVLGPLRHLPRMARHRPEDRVPTVGPVLELVGDALEVGAIRAHDLAAVLWLPLTAEEHLPADLADDQVEHARAAMASKAMLFV